MLMGQSRVFYSMSQDGLLPKLFSEVHPRFKTPYVAIIASSLVMLVLFGVLGGFLLGVGRLPVPWQALLLSVAIYVALPLVAKVHRDLPKFLRGPALAFWVFHVIRDYGWTLKEGNSAHLSLLPALLVLAQKLEEAVGEVSMVFGHNDLLPANFIDDGACIWLIDYEYAAFSTAMFDLAGIASNALFGPEQDRELLSAYFGCAPEPELERSHAAMKCASLLREAMWSMVSEIHLDAPGVDYVAYTAENLARFDEALDSYRSRFGKVPA